MRIDSTFETVIENNIEYLVETTIMGTVYWWFKGKLHREGGPAMITFFGDHFWFCDNQHHRLDGPATIRKNGDQEWWYYNQHILNIHSQEEFEQWLKLKVFE